jgi:hypothetical protein
LQPEHFQNFSNFLKYVAGAPQSCEIPDLFHANHLRSSVLSLFPFFLEPEHFQNFKYLGIEECQLELLNHERFQPFSTQITLGAPFLLYFLFIWNQNIFKILSNILKYLGIEKWLLELLNLERLQTFSTQITLGALLFQYSLFFGTRTFSNFSQHLKIFGNRGMAAGAPQC